MQREVLASTPVIPERMVRENFEMNFVSGNADQYWLNASDLTAIARRQYNIPTDYLRTFRVEPAMRPMLGNLIRSMRDERRQYSVVILNDENHWTALVLWLQPDQINVNDYYKDSFGHPISDHLWHYLKESGVARINDLSVIQQQTDGFNCGFWALMNSRTIIDRLQS